MPSCWRCTVTWLPNFLVWVDLLIHGAPQARFARQSSANKTSSYICYFKDFEIHIWCVFIYSLHTSNNWGSKAFEAQSKLLFGDFLQRYPMKFWSRSWNTPLWGRLWALCAEFLKDWWGYATQIVCGRLSPLMSGWSRKLINTQWQQ